MTHATYLQYIQCMYIKPVTWYVLQHDLIKGEREREGGREGEGGETEYTV